jgi:hypothetical protein
VSQTVWRSEADGDPIDFDVTVRSSVPGSPWCPDQLHRNLGWEGAGVRDQPIVLSYTGGFTVAPDSVREACLLVVQKVYRDGARQQADVATVSTPGGAMTLYDSFIPRRAQQILDAHRRILV